MRDEDWNETTCATRDWARPIVSGLLLDHDDHRPARGPSSGGSTISGAVRAFTNGPAIRADGAPDF